MRSDWGKSGTDSAQRKILTGCVASVVLAGIFLTRWQRRKKKNDPRA